MKFKKVTVTLSDILVSNIDSYAAYMGLTRSGAFRVLLTYAFIAADFYDHDNGGVINDKSDAETGL